MAYDARKSSHTYIHIHYMTDLAIQSIRKIAHVDSLPNRATGFS